MKAGKSRRPYPQLLAALLIIATAVVSYGLVKSRQDTTLSFIIAGTSRTTQVSAALSAVPTQSDMNVGDLVTLDLAVDSTDQPVNAVAGTITYPSDQVEPVSISTSTSIIDYWIQDPTPMASSSITFAGIIPSPGFTGSRGQILTVSFRAKQEGVAIVDIKDAQVLANDGKGTDILAQTIPATLNIVTPKPREVADINGDGKVDFTDLSMLIANWGIPKDPRADLDNDGAVDLHDVSILVSRMMHE
jgi:hypothetical protein